MLVLDFTNKKLSSSKNVAYFKRWNRIFGQNGDVDDDYSVSKGNKLSKVRTTDDSRSFASYFNSVRELNRKTKWIFGDGNKVINLEEFQFQKEIEPGNIIRNEGFFVDNVFELGGGTNILNFRVDIEAEDKITDSLRNRLKGKGYKATIKGGSGIDRINIEFDSDASFKLSQKSSITIDSGGGKDSIVMDTDFLISPKINSGNGADTVNLQEANSSRVKTGKGRDTIFLGRDEPDDLTELNVVENVKDVITGGSSSDRFIFNDEFAYSANGNKDFCVITDYQSNDSIILFENADLQINGKDGTVNLSATGAYRAQSIDYTARLYAGGDLIAYIAGDQPTINDITQYP